MVVDILIGVDIEWDFSWFLIGWFEEFQPLVLQIMLWGHMN